MKKFIVDNEVWNTFPNMSIGVLVIHNSPKKLTKKENKEIAEMLAKTNKEAKKYVPNETFAENEVIKIWREAYQKFPTKKGARCSIENLLKRVLHDNPVMPILPDVDITNIISLKYALPIGAEDLDKIIGDLHLGISDGTESFIPIGAESEEPPLKGEIAYKDDVGIVCRCLNWRDGIRTSITDNTEKEFIAMECLDLNRIKDLEEAINELATLLTKYLNISIITKEIVNAKNPEIIIE